jgi:hypothetical protein
MREVAVSMLHQRGEVIDAYRDAAAKFNNDHYYLQHSETLGPSQLQRMLCLAQLLVCAA